MVDYLMAFVDEIYIRVSGIVANLTGVSVPNASEPVICLAYVIAYLFLLVVIIRLVIAVVRWFYRI